MRSIEFTVYNVSGNQMFLSDRACEISYDLKVIVKSIRCTVDNYIVSYF